MALKTQGTALYTIDPATDALLAIGCITSIDGIDTSIDQVETTCLQDAARTYMAGLATPGAASFGINTDTGDAAHVRLHQLKTAGTTLRWALGWSDGTVVPAVGQGVGSVNVSAGGTGYTTATVTFSAPGIVGGVTATGTVTVAAGVITAVTITNPGSGYTSAPTATFAGAGGSGATGTAVLDGIGDFVLADTRSWITFEGFMNSYPFSFSQNDVVKSTIGIQVSGEPVLIPKV